MRFRPILLTSLTTFFGLVPIVLERSMQAQIVIPMAVSLAFGIVFATAITLILIPCLYNIQAEPARAVAAPVQPMTACAPIDPGHSWTESLSVGTGAPFIVTANSPLFWW